VSPNPFLTTDQITTIFSTVAGITSFNRTLLEKLRERVNAWSPTQLIGDVFCTMVRDKMWEEGGCEEGGCEEGWLTSC
jgi:hypothetical protein